MSRLLALEAQRFISMKRKAAHEHLTEVKGQTFEAYVFKMLKIYFFFVKKELPVRYFEEKN